MEKPLWLRVGAWVAGVLVLSSGLGWEVGMGLGLIALSIK